MRGCNPARTPGVGPELSLDQPEENLLKQEGKQVFRYNIFYTVNELTRAMSKSSMTYMGVVKHLLCYLAGSTDFSATYKQGGFKLTPFPTQTGEQTPIVGSLHQHTS